ncbi:hypothetical protein O1611_g6842 [Lasiodiplodia mahajangana]|uniref:Uncharacterized protein n=1 Tax=Lasiodiplodia mahajangana TaxID=1108764 RepID=A0ACC2JH90_9PEZI|nr:hypothetical protein O1611_g6842 [Lasiodiplodia mahajangana]
MSEWAPASADNWGGTGGTTDGWGGTGGATDAQWTDAHCANRYPLGWQPKWDKQKLLASLDEEITATLQYDKGKTTLFDVLDASD